MDPPTVSVGKGGIGLQFEPRKLGEQEKTALKTYDAILATVNELNEFKAPEIAQYVGLMNRPVQEAKRWIPGLASDRYEHFRSIVMRLKSSAFGEGGKQLTPFEYGVVSGFTPTGDEPRIEAFLQKVGGLRRFTTIRRNLVAYYSRQGIDASQVPETQWDQAMKLGLGSVPTGPTAGRTPPARSGRGPGGTARGGPRVSGRPGAVPLPGAPGPTTPAGVLLNPQTPLEHLARFAVAAPAIGLAGAGAGAAVPAALSPAAAIAARIPAGGGVRGGPGG